MGEDKCRFNSEEEAISEQLDAQLRSVMHPKDRIVFWAHLAGGDCPRLWFVGKPVLASLRPFVACVRWPKVEAPFFIATEMPLKGVLSDAAIEKMHEAAAAIRIRQPRGAFRRSDRRA